MSEQVTLTTTEAMSLLMLLKSLTYEGLNSEDGVHFQATLMNLGERIEQNDPGLESAQFDLWKRLGEPGWASAKSDQHN